jgi:hypothetical protein
MSTHPCRHTINTLRAQARTRKLPGRSKMKKDELFKALYPHTAPCDKTVAAMRAIAKRKKMHGYSSWTKTQLYDALYGNAKISKQPSKPAPAKIKRHQPSRKAPKKRVPLPPLCKNARHNRIPTHKERIFKLYLLTVLRKYAYSDDCIVIEDVYYKPTALKQYQRVWEKDQKGRWKTRHDVGFDAKDVQTAHAKIAACMQQKPKPKRIIIQLTLELGAGSHANVLIYHRTLNKLFVYDPHGFSSALQTISGDTGKNLFVENVETQLLKDVVPRGGIREVELPSKLCPTFRGEQSKFSSEQLSEAYNYYKPGLCAMWSLYYTVQALLKPSTFYLPSHVRYDKALKTLRREARKNGRRPQEYLVYWVTLVYRDMLQWIRKLFPKTTKEEEFVCTMHEFAVAEKLNDFLKKNSNTNMLNRIESRMLKAIKSHVLIRKYTYG